MCAQGDLDLVRKYVAMGGRLDAVDYDARSAMHVSCANGHVALVAFLLIKGPNACELADAIDAFGRTPLDEVVIAAVVALH